MQWCDVSKQAFLVLEDGSAYRGEAFGAQRSAYGEVVFNTSMTGYQEMLTDPSYAGQIVVLTYPLIGNYGINERDSESRRIQVSGFVVREHSLQPSHMLSTGTVHDFLESQGVPGISGLDTRAVTRRLRSHGVMMGVIAVEEPPEQALARLRDLPRYGDTDFVKMGAGSHSSRSMRLAGHLFGLSADQIVEVPRLRFGHETIDLDGPRTRPQRMGVS